MNNFLSYSLVGFNSYHLFRGFTEGNFFIVTLSLIGIVFSILLGEGQE